MEADASNYFSERKEKARLVYEAQREIYCPFCSDERGGILGSGGNSWGEENKSENCFAKSGDWKYHLLERDVVFEKEKR